jgi:hypothetical protein
MRLVYGHDARFGPRSHRLVRPGDDARHGHLPPFLAQRVPLRSGGEVTKMNLTLAQARAAFQAGEPVTMTRESNPTAREMTSNKSAAWQYATVKAYPVLMWKAPGTQAWRAITGTERGTHARALRCALSILTGEYDPMQDTYEANDWRTPSTEDGQAIPDAPVTFLAAVPCRECGEELTTPSSIRDGVGPVCSGRYAEMTARADAKRAHWQTVNLASAPAPMPTKPARTVNVNVPASATVATCNGRCNPMEYCPACDA